MIDKSSSNYTMKLPPSPIYSFVGGMSYDTSPRPSTSSPFSAKSYSGENYARFRLYNAIEDSHTYRSAIYANLPMAAFQYEGEAVGFAFEPLSDGKPMSVCISSTGDQVVFEYRSGIKHLLRGKSSRHLGPWEIEEEYITDVPIGQVREIHADSWMQLVRDYVYPRLGAGLPANQISDAVHMAIAFYNRAFDSGNSVHVDTLLPSAPGDYVELIYSYPSFEACRLASLTLAGETPPDRLRAIADRLLCDEASVPLRELGDIRVWHNALMRDGDSDLVYATGYGTGYSGYPGGMAYTLRGLIQYCALTGRSDARDRICSGLNWLLAVQLPDGGLPFNMPTFRDCLGWRGRCRTGPRSRAAGGAAEAIRTLCAGYRFLGDKRYLDAAQKAAAAVNPQGPHYAFRGYGDLRDAGDYESDSTSGCSLGNANLDLFELTGDHQYLETALALGYYVLTWHFWWTPGPEEILGLIDPMAESFSPHASPWNTALSAQLYCRLYRHTGDEFWMTTARYVYSQCLQFQNPSTGAISEAYPISMDGSYTDMGAESGMVTWALIDGGLAVLDALDHPWEPRVETESVHVRSDLSIGVNAEVALFDLETRCMDRVKTLFKMVARGAARKLGKKLPISMASRLREPVKRPTQTRTPARWAGPVRSIQLTPGDSLESFAFQADTSSVVTLLSLRSSTYTANVKRVLMPVLSLPSRVTEFRVVEKVADTIVAVHAGTEDGTSFEIRFLPGTDGIGPSSVDIDDGRLAFDVTLKALWQRAGICTQRISIAPTVMEVG